MHTWAHTFLQYMSVQFTNTYSVIIQYSIYNIIKHAVRECKPRFAILFYIKLQYFDQLQTLLINSTTLVIVGLNLKKNLHIFIWYKTQWPLKPYRRFFVGEWCCLLMKIPWHFTFRYKLNHTNYSFCQCFSERAFIQIQKYHITNSLC